MHERGVVTIATLRSLGLPRATRFHNVEYEYGKALRIQPQQEILRNFEDVIGCNRMKSRRWAPFEVTVIWRSERLTIRLDPLGLR